MKIEKYKDLVDELHNFPLYKSGIMHMDVGTHAAYIEAERFIKHYIRNYIVEEEAREKQEMEKEAALESASSALTALEAIHPGITLSLLRGMASNL